MRRLFNEAVRFCLDRKRDYRNSKKTQPSKTVRRQEIYDFMNNKARLIQYKVDKLPGQRTLNQMIADDKRRRNPTGHTRARSRLANKEIDQEALLSVNHYSLQY